MRAKEVMMKMRDKIFNKKLLPPVVVVLVATMLLLCAIPASGRTLGNTTNVTGTVVWPEIVGQIRAVNCNVLSGANVTAYVGAVEKASTLSDGSGNYTLAVPELGNYNVTVGQAGFRSETQAISVTEVTNYALDFVADHGLVPNAPNLSYVLACIHLWKFGAPPCQLGMLKVLAVMNDWKNPII